MDLLYELESLAVNAAGDTSSDVPPTSEETERWQSLFNLDASAARDNMIQYRADITRLRISYELWEDIRESKLSQGYDREAYEYFVFCHSKRSRPAKKRPTSVDDTHTYAILLSGPFDSPERVKDIAGLRTVPRLGSVESSSNASATEVCYIDARAKQRITEWLARQGSDYKPVFMTFSIARKQLSSDSAYPTLGLDTTMPQNRPDAGALIEPAQNQYPVWYFFYGTLAEPDRLMRLLLLPEVPVLLLAGISMGIIKTWSNKYRALIDGPVNAAEIAGHAFLVESQAQEEALRVYEGSMYEVVRCTIHLPGRTISGLTFRFIHEIQLD